MRKLISVLLGLIAALALAGIAVAAEEQAAAVAAPAALDYGKAYITIVYGMTIVAVGCAFAQTLGLKSACDGTARNPEAGGRLMITLILGLAFIESLAIYALVVNLILLFTKL